MPQISTSNYRIDALKSAFPFTLPIMAGYWFLGIAYGVLMSANGFSFWWPVLTAAVVYSGSVEFIAVTLLLSNFNPVQAFTMAIMVGARHLFYGISMLDKYKSVGRKKAALIYLLTDETFSINYMAKIPEGIDKSWFYFWVSVLDYSYWLTGTLMGGLFGSLITFNMKGLGFVMTAMFVVIFMEQWLKDEDHTSFLIGLGLPLICLCIFGSENFIIPSMIAILLALTLLRPFLERKEAESCK